MEASKYKEVKKIVIDYITEVELKPLLEENEIVANLYDNDDMTNDDFYKMVEEIKNDALKGCE
jgi:hypothetical protein